MILLAIIIGAIWRRNWGDERPSWAFPGYRGMQAVAGFVAAALVMWASMPIIFAVAGAAASVGVCTLPIAWFRPIWWLWEQIHLRWGVPDLGRLFYQYTNYAESTQGAVVFAVAFGGAKCASWL